MYDHIVAECFVSLAAAHHRNKQTETDAMVLMAFHRRTIQGVGIWLLSLLFCHSWPRFEQILLRANSQKPSTKELF